MIDDHSGALRSDVNRSCLRLSAAAVALIAAVPLSSMGQGYPAQVVKLIIPIAPGGTSDILGRVLAQHMSKNTGKQFIVENKAGASGIIGTQSVAKSTPDGSTLLLTTATHTINPSLYKKLPYDAVSDFSAVSIMASTPMVMVVHPSLQANSIQDFLGLARKMDGQLNYGSAGAGTPSHLAVELFANMTKTNFVHVSYKGGGPSMADFIAGQTQFRFNAIVPILPMLKANKVKAIGVTSTSRVAMLPDVPTIAESGVGAYEFGLWYAMLGPAGMNANITDFLSNEVRKALSNEQVKSKVEADGGHVLATTPKAAADHIRKELDRYSSLIKAAGIPAVDL